MFFTHGFLILAVGLTIPKLVQTYIWGKIVNRGKWPWTVQVGMTDMVSCTGSVISDQWILTAAHCLTDNPKASPPNISDLNLNFSPKESGGENLTIKGSEIHLHPEYNGSQNALASDIALIKLKTSIDFNKTSSVKPACLGLEEIQLKDLECVGAGYGSTDEKDPTGQLSDLGMKEFDHQQCAELHNEFHNKTSLGMLQQMTESHFCMVSSGPTSDNNTDDLSSGSGAPGDDGGPLQCLINDQWVQVGVTWSGTQLGTNPTVYNRLDKYSDWIKKVSSYQRPSKCWSNEDMKKANKPVVESYSIRIFTKPEKPMRKKYTGTTRRSVLKKLRKMVVVRVSKFIKERLNISIKIGRKRQRRDPD